MTGINSSDPDFQASLKKDERLLKQNVGKTSPLKSR